MNHILVFVENKFLRTQQQHLRGFWFGFWFRFSIHLLFFLRNLHWWSHVLPSHLVLQYGHWGQHAGTAQTERHVSISLPVLYLYFYKLSLHLWQGFFKTQQHLQVVVFGYVFGFGFWFGFGFAAVSADVHINSKQSSCPQVV